MLLSSTYDTFYIPLGALESAAPSTFPRHAVRLLHGLCYLHLHACEERGRSTTRKPTTRSFACYLALRYIAIDDPLSELPAFPRRYKAVGVEILNDEM